MEGFSIPGYYTIELDDMITLNEGDEYKFRCNNDWAINLGGVDEYNLVPNGANLKAPAAGTYTITLDLSVVPYACYLE